MPVEASQLFSSVKAGASTDLVISAKKYILDININQIRGTSRSKVSCFLDVHYDLIGYKPSNISRNFSYFLKGNVDDISDSKYRLIIYKNLINDYDCHFPIFLFNSESNPYHFQINHLNPAGSIKLLKSIKQPIGSYFLLSIGCHKFYKPFLYDMALLDYISEVVGKHIY